MRGLEKVAESPGKVHTDDQGGAECGAFRDRELEQLIAMWPNLGDEAREKIMTFVASTSH